MTEAELAIILQRRYETAKRNEAAMQIHLFAIEYADEIRKGDFTIAHLVETAGITKGYAAEISKGIKLSEHVKTIKTGGKANE